MDLLEEVGRMGADFDGLCDARLVVVELLMGERSCPSARAKSLLLFSGTLKDLLHCRRSHDA